MNNRKFTILVIGLLVLFFLVRLPGISLPYHQDEWKNVMSSSSAVLAGQFFAHPPLMQVLLVVGYKIFGVDHFRYFPLIFSLASAFLLYVVVRNRAGKGSALFSLLVYLVLFYNILGSLVPDVDGSILPFFFLLSVYFYDKWNAADSAFKWKWFSVLNLALLAGFLTKLSFILVVGVIIADYILNNWRTANLKKVGFGILSLGLFIATYIGLIYFINYIYHPFDISIMLGHASQFGEGISRNWIQIVVQGMKAIFYLSPLAIVPLVFISRDVFKKTRIFSIYLVFGLIFYFIIFDFSRGALDKYLMYAIVPLSVIVGSIFAEIFRSEITSERNRKWWQKTAAIGVVVSLALVALNFLPHEVLPLYPKTLWFTRVFHGNWLILNPFNGGSGPLGFYVSFLFIALSFIFSLVCVCIGLFKKQWKPAIALILIFVGLSYNVVFAEELFFGKINGSAPEALKKAVLFIDGRKDITKVITYNDIGAGMLEKMGKYTGRIYATPESEDKYKVIFEKHVAVKGHFLVVGIPPLGQETFYGKFFSKCDSLFKTTSGRTTADVYSCHRGK